MNRDRLDGLLGGGDLDPGCEACFDVFDAYAEAVLSGADVDLRFPGVAAHLAGCPACREDAEGILAALRREQPPEERR
jgi:hypothetical protein